MKKIFLLFGILISLNAYSQNIQELKNKVKFYKLPYYPLTENLNTYSVNLDKGTVDFSGQAFDEKVLPGMLKLNSYKLVQESGDFNVTLKFGDYSIQKREVVEIPKNNQKTYKYQFTVLMPAKLLITKKDGTVLQDVDFNTEPLYQTYPPENDKFGLPVPVVPDSKALETWATKEMKNLENDCRMIFIRDAFYKASRMLPKSIDYSAEMKDVEFFYFKNGKDENLNKWQEIANNAITSLALYNDGVSYDEVSGKIESSINFWQGELGKYDISNKDHNNIIGVGAYNLFLAYLWTNKFDEAKLTFEKYKSLSWKRNDEFVEVAKELDSRKEAYLANKGKTIDFSKFGKDLVILGENQYLGDITTSKGTKTECVFSLMEPFGFNPSELQMAVFYTDLNTFKQKYGVLSPKDKILMKADDIKSATINGSKYETVSAIDISALSLTGTKYLLKKVKDGKLNVYIYYELAGDHPSNGPKVVTGGGGGQISVEASRSRPEPVFIPTGKAKGNICINEFLVSEAFKESNPEIFNTYISGGYGNKKLDIPSSKLMYINAKSTAGPVNLDAALKAADEFNSK